MKLYSNNKNVLKAARERIAMLFDHFDDISISVSSGKDSSVLFHLCLMEAERRNRPVRAFFLDQEAEYDHTIEVIQDIMTRDNVIPEWFQVPMYMTNATSYSDYFLYAWGPGENWMRDKNPVAIKQIDEDYPQRFYEFFPWWEKKRPEAAYLVGLRADESLTRFRAVTKRPGWNGIKWGSLAGGVKTFYPIYDWTVYDVWKYIWDFDIKYNKIYDYQFMAGYSIYKTMRISNLIHEKSYKCLVDLPRFEPDTYDRLCRRIAGISTAGRYAGERLMFDNKTLPKHYESWRQFRDFLLKNIPEDSHRERFKKRFAKQPNTEKTYQAQVGQLLINDYENNTSIDTKRAERARKVKEKWMEIL